MCTHTKFKSNHTNNSVGIRFPLATSLHLSFFRSYSSVCSPSPSYWGFDYCPPPPLSLSASLFACLPPILDSSPSLCELFRRCLVWKHTAKRNAPLVIRTWSIRIEIKKVNSLEKNAFHWNNSCSELVAIGTAAADGYTDPFTIPKMLFSPQNQNQRYSNIFRSDLGNDTFQTR